MHKKYLMPLLLMRYLYTCQRNSQDVPELLSHQKPTLSGMNHQLYVPAFYLSSEVDLANAERKIQLKKTNNKSRNFRRSQYDRKGNDNGASHAYLRNLCLISAQLRQ